MKTILGNIAIVTLALMISACGSEKKDYLDRMDEEHKDDVPVENAASETPQSAEVTEETVTYATVNGNEITGYLAKPEGAEGDLPGLIVIHEWWGLNDNIRMMTRRLAGEGYVALAVDLYNGKVAESPDSAGTYARSVEQEPALDNRPCIGPGTVRRFGYFSIIKIHRQRHISFTGQAPRHHADIVVQAPPFVNHNKAGQI